MTRYALDNQHDAAVAHHQALAELLDPYTRERIQRLPQWPTVRHALDVGAGGGSMARWLASQQVDTVAADLDPVHVAPAAHLEVVACDLVAEEQRLAARLGAGWDLILARLTCQHLPNRDRLLPAVAQLLAPGGVLLVEDWLVRDAHQQYIPHAPTEADRELMVAYRRATTAAFDRAGTDRQWARRCWRAMVGSGLDQVTTCYAGGYWPGSSPGMRLMGTTAAQLRPVLREAGLTDAQLDRVVALTQDPAFVMEGYPLYSTSGVRRADGS